MGMGYAAAYADVIEDKSIRIFCQEELDNFMDLIDKNDIDFQDFAASCAYGDIEDYSEDIVKAFEVLVKKFHEKTGLKLYLGCHSSEDSGDRYDDINGAYWSVDGMYELTEAGKKMKQYVERKQYVQFG